VRFVLPGSGLLVQPGIYHPTNRSPPPSPFFLARDFNAWSLAAALSLTNHWVIKKWREYGSHFTTFSRERCFYEYRHGEFVSR
jgi:hypothetical protein